MSFNTEYNRYYNRVENWIKEEISDEKFQKRIFDAMNYSLLAGGKRIRPVLALATCDMLGGDEELVLPFAAAIEMIHTYSLIHDDLPCMDNDDFRRGKPTNHKVFGEAMAVLAGDGLLNLAFETMLKETIKDDEKCLLRSKAALLIAEAAGASGMIGGQVLDMESGNQIISYEQLCEMHQNKTGALIKAAILAPAELMDISDEKKKLLRSYADSIGLAFQIKDDILDNEGNSAVLGKSTGKDKKNNKATFVTLLGTEKAAGLLKGFVKQAVEALKFLPNNDFLVKMAVYIAEREK